MEWRLFHAAQTGNEGELQQLLKDDPLILHAVSLSSSETPLHIASLAGHLSFVKQIIHLKPEFAKELNQDGFSPMHIASANGHLEIVKELLKVDLDLCCLKGRDGRTPLHYAAIKGRVDVIRELLNSCVDSAGEVTFRGETALHLAVKNHQFQAFQNLVEILKQLNKEDVLNRKDERGNTALHLATSKKQREVVELLLNKDAVTATTVEVNAMNECNLTALDVLLMFPSEAGDREIEEILRQAGAMRAQDVTSATPHGTIQNNPLVPVPSQSFLLMRCFKFWRGRHSQSSLDSLEEYFKFRKGRDSPSHARDALLVLAILIATATYQAGLSPPGGVWQDNTNPNDNNSTNTIKPHFAGKSILGSSSKVFFGVFVFFNSVGFHVSLFIINTLTCGFPLRLELQISMTAMIFTYYTAMTTVVPGDMTLFVNALSIILPITISLVVKWVRQSSQTCRQPLGDTNDTRA